MNLAAGGPLLLATFPRDRVLFCGTEDPQQEPIPGVGLRGQWAGLVS